MADFLIQQYDELMGWKEHLQALDERTGCTDIFDVSCQFKRALELFLSCIEHLAAFLTEPQPETLHLARQLLEEADMTMEHAHRQARLLTVAWGEVV
ncbi:MAG: hypothetical protein AB1758_19635 [Candidatus Eremiobacterota bacterium]